MYKCIKGFSIPVCDDDGFILENESMLIEKDSIWNVSDDKDYRLAGGEVRLIRDTLEWVEVDNITLKTCFIEIN